MQAVVLDFFKNYHTWVDSRKYKAFKRKQNQKNTRTLKTQANTTAKIGNIKQFSSP